MQMKGFDMCENKVIQYVPRGYDYRAVESRCGSTGIHGQRLLCDACQSNSAVRENLRRQDANADADNAWLRSAGWGEM